MADEPTPSIERPEIERLLLHSGQLQFNIEVMKAALLGANQRINEIQQASLKVAAAPEVPPAQA